MKGTQGAIHFDITGDETDLKRALASSRSAILASGDAAEQQGARIEQMFKRATSGAVAFFSVAKATDFVKSMATVHGEFQSIQIALNTILGSEAEATKLFEQLKDTAAKTPFDLKGVASGAKQLLAYGESADTVNDTLIKLGNIAAGLSQPLGDIVYLYGTTMTQGRLYTQDLNQFTGRGIPMIRELAREFGVAESEVKKLVESGKVGFPEVQKVINNLTSETGMFYDLMEKQSQAVTGKISNLQDAWSVALDEMGKSSEGFLYSGIEGATYLVEHYEQVGEIIAKLVTVYGAYKAALIALNTVEKLRYQATLAHAAGLTNLQAVMTVLKAKTEALTAAMMKNPYAIVAAAIAGMAYGIYELATYMTDAEKAQKRLSEASAEAQAEAITEQRELAKLKGELEGCEEGTEQYEAAKTKIIEKFGQYDSSLKQETLTVQTLTDKYDSLSAAILKSYNTRKYNEFSSDQSKELEQTITSNLDKIYSRLIKELGDEYGTKVYTQIQDAITKGVELPTNVQEVLDKIQDKGTIAADSRIDSQIRSIREAIKLNDELDAQARKRFGIEGTGSSSSKTPVVTKQFKSFAEQVEAAKNRIVTLKQELKDLLAGKGDVSNFAQAIEDKRKEISQAEDAYAYLRGLDPKRKSSDTTPSTDYKTKIADQGREIERLYRDLELSIEKTIVDTKKEGLEKVLAQNELNHQMEIESIQRQKEDLLRKIQEKERTIWESEHPDWNKKGLTFTPTTKELSSEDIKKFDKQTKTANEKLIADNKRAFDEMLADYLTYEEKRSKVTEEHERKRKALYNEDGTLREGVTQGNVDEVNRAENEALKAVDEEFAQREESFQAWMNDITKMTLQGLEDALEKAKAALDEAEKSGVGGSKLAEARAKVNIAEKKVKTAKAEEVSSPGRRTVKEWEDLYKTLMEVEREFESIGDTVDGVAGEIISTAGQMMTSTLSMISSITQLANWGIISTKMTAEGASKAIQTVEKASVILTIISAAMQIAMTIVNLFNNDEEYQKEIEKLQRRIDQLKWELDNAEAVRMQKNAGDILERVKQVYVETRAEVLKLHAAEIRRGGFFARLLSETTYKNDILAKSADKLAKAYANIEYTADKALGSAKYDEAKDKLQNIAQQQLLIQEQIKKEDAKKKTDHGKIEDWERQIVELGEEANKIINEIVEDIIGGSASDIAKELADAFFDAFQAGEDAAEAWGAKVNDIVGDVIRRMLIQKFLEEPLGKIFNDYKSKWFKDGDLKENGGIDAIMESMNGFANDLNQVGEDFQTIWDNLPDSIKNLITVDEESREASERGIATASQESVDENNGRLTVIQSHTYTMNENVKTLVLLSDKMLEAMVAIRTNTEYCRKLDKLDNIDKEITQMKRRLDDFGDNGLKMK